MITDSKFVGSVESNSPKKGWKITWQDGRRDNFFDNSWLAILEEAQQTNRMVTVTKEKNDAGYWNIMTLKIAEELPSKEPSHETVSEHMPPKPEPAPQAVGMITKEIGDMIRASRLENIFGEIVGKELVRWYRSQTLGITRITHDTKNLPEY